MRGGIFTFFTFFLVLFFLIYLPLNSYASTLTYNKFMELTSSGVSKVGSSASRIAGAKYMSRALLGMNALTAGMAIALVLWDGSKRYRDYAKVNIPAGSVSIGASVPTSVTTSEASYGWGRATSNIAFPYNVTYGLSCPGDPCNCYVHGPSSGPTSTPPSTATVVGGYYHVKLTTYTGCPSRTITYVSQITDYLYYVSNPAVTASYVPQPLSTPIPTSEQSNSRLAYETIRQALGKLESERSNARASAAGLAGQYNVSIPNVNVSYPLLSDGFNFSRNGVAVSEGVDYVVVSPQDAIPVPQGEVTPDVEKPHDELVSPPISDGVCSDCQKTKTFSDVLQGVSNAVSGSSILALLNKLIINPYGSQVNDVISFNVSGFGQVAFDLNQFHYQTIVAVFRFMVIAGAFIAAYYIIFS